MTQAGAAAEQARLDRRHMAHALALAEQARDAEEVPVGAVVALGDEIVGRGHNQTITQCDPGAHAEMLAIRDAAHAIGNHRLNGASLYVTLEPCIMCAGAILHARITRLIFGAPDKKSGAAGSALNLLESPFLNHRCKVIGGVEAERCGELLVGFFAERRGR